MAMMALPLAAPFIDVLVVRGGLRWLGAYGLIVAMGAAAAALAVGADGRAVPHHRPEAHALRGAGRRRRDRRRLRHRPAGRGDPVLSARCRALAVLQSDTVLAHAPDLGSVVWWPARAALGDGVALCAVLRRELRAARASPSRWSRRASATMPSPRRGVSGSPASAASRRSRLPQAPRRGRRCAARNGCCCGAIPGWCRRR